MKTCKFCKRKIEEEVQSCSMTTLVAFNQRWKPILFGSEKDYSGEKYCPDCKVTTNGRHHVYCPVEECPNCHNKMNKCGCFYVLEE